ncbi:hypothetical protein SAMN04487907_10711 [Zunongwangia mangrovi]|uniref:Uncharacterized protein n=1 Tax=Zunongwangia mangrovi TaxID=1334022 RepID=A0A1I1L7I3_9FLAO|nr:hypothetical protein [Zunongwangia mangrovi]SFC66988.1 hypothetical protein SAMN04487907_10711 [Zunongwangia mangrovi]
MKNLIEKSLSLFLLLVILVSCESEELIEQDQEINYKQKLSEIITLNPVDEAYSKQETRNELPPLNFDTYKEAYDYFKENKTFYSDTLVSRMEPVNSLANQLKSNDNTTLY